MNRFPGKVLLNLGLSTIAILITSSAFVLDRVSGLSLPRVVAWAGWPFLAASTVLIIWAVVCLARAGLATGAPGDPTKAMVRIGPYAKIRNPIYAGDGLLLIGLALVTSSPSLLLYDAIYALAIDRYVRRVEEPALERRFGPEYAVYKASVPRWFPRLPAERGSEG